MSEEQAATPQANVTQTGTNDKAKTTGRAKSSRGPACDYKFAEGRGCQKNGLYEVEGRHYCLNHARQFQKRQAKLKEGPKQTGGGRKKILPPEPTRPPKQEEKVEIPSMFENSSSDVSEEDEEEEHTAPSMKEEMPVEQLVIDTPKRISTKADEEKKRSPAVEKPHRESKLPKKSRRMQFEEESETETEDSDEEDSPPPQKKQRIKKKKLDLSQTYTFPTGEKRLKNLFKSATQLNTNGRMRKPGGSVFGLFK